MIALDEKAIALRLAQLREKKGVSARDMSLTIGQNPGYINNIESGKSLPSVTGLLYICEYLNMSPRDFFDFDAENPTRLNAVINNLKRLNDQQLAIIEALVKDLVQG